MNYGGPPVRLILYGDPYSEEEKAKLKEFKDFSKTNNEAILDVDEEIVRFLYARKFDNEKTLDAMKARFVYRENLPLQVTSKTFELLNNGMMYL